MGKRPQLARAELEVARILWRLGGGTVRQVLDQLPPDRDLDYKTVQTYLRRLEAKGYLTSKLKGRSRTYRPRVEPGRVIRDTVRDFVVRLFDGDPLPLFEHFVRDQRLSDAEIQELRSLLDRLEAERDAARKR